MTIIITDFEKKLLDLIDSCTWVNNRTEVARYCGVKPQAVTFWCQTERLTQQRINQIEELFDAKDKLLLGWGEFWKFIQDRIKEPSNPWRRLLIEADPHSILEICRREVSATTRIIPEYEPDDEPEECYRRGEKIYLKMELPNALLWAKHSLVLAKNAETVRTVCPSEFCPDTAIVEPRFTLPKNIEGDVFKTTGDGLQSLVTIITAKPLPDNLCQSLHNEANKLPEDVLRKLAIEIKARPERERHVYRRDFRVK